MSLESDRFKPLAPPQGQKLNSLKNNRRLGSSLDKKRIISVSLGGGILGAVIGLAILNDCDPRVALKLKAAREQIASVLDNAATHGSSDIRRMLPGSLSDNDDELPPPIEFGDAGLPAKTPLHPEENP